MLKEGGVTVLEWLVSVFNICFMLSIVPVDCVIACMVPLYKGKEMCMGVVILGV